MDKVLAPAHVGSEMANFDFPMFTKFGEHRESLPNTTTRRGPNDEVIGVLGVGQDITQICEITKEQERVADVLSRLIDSAMRQSGVNLNRMATEWNRKAAEISGYPKQETMGKNLVQNFVQSDYRMPD